MTQQDRKRLIGLQQTWARVHRWPLLPPTRHEVTLQPRPPFAARSLCPVCARYRAHCACHLPPPTAPAMPAGPSVIATDNHHTPQGLHPGLWPHRVQPSFYARHVPQQTYLAETKRDLVAAWNARRPTPSPYLLCALCGAPAQETSLLAPQTEGMCLPAD